MAGYPIDICKVNVFIGPKSPITTALLGPLLIVSFITHMLSDEQYIERIKRSYNRRKRIGVLGLIMAVVSSCVVFYMFKNNSNINRSLLEAFQMLHPGHAVTNMDIKSIETANKLAYASGQNIGVFLGSSLVFIGFIISVAFSYFFGMRKDKLLLKYYDKSKN